MAGIRMICAKLRRLWVALAAALIVFPITAQDLSRGEHVSLPWYVNATAVHRVTLKPTSSFRRYERLSLEPAAARHQMLEWKGEGISALEIFAPEEGGNSYNGLDAKDRYRLDPGLGTMADFRGLVNLAHVLDLRVITFQNLGYSSVDAEQFKKAQDEIRDANPSGKGDLYFWSKQGDAPPPVTGNSYFLMQQSIPGHEAEENELWQWSERAHEFYWTRWAGKDSQGRANHLPQYNWSATAWPEEAGRVVRFWMDTGIDGMVLDAVNWYAGATWQRVNRQITHVIAGYGNTFIQPEGGGAFYTDDPVGWVTEGGFTNIYDYGLGVWWEKKNQPLLASVAEGRPDLLEQALSGYHDRVVAARGTLYFPVPKAIEPSEQTFVEALIATSGDLPCYCDPQGGITKPAPGIPELLRLKAAHAALFQDSLRRRIPTSKPAQIYATLRLANDRSERILAVFNFSRQRTDADIDTGAIDGGSYLDMLSGKEEAVNAQKLHIRLSGHGYRIFQVLSRHGAADDRTNIDNKLRGGNQAC